MQIPVTDVDEPILYRDLASIRRAPEVIQIALAILTLGRRADKRQINKRKGPQAYRSSPRCLFSP